MAQIVRSTLIVNKVILKREQIIVFIFQCAQRLSVSTHMDTRMLTRNYVRAHSRTHKQALT